MKIKLDNTRFRRRWRNYVLLILTLAALLCPLKAKGESADKWAHFGVSFALQTVAYGLTTKALGFREDRVTPDERVVAVVLSAAVVLALTSLKEFSDEGVDGQDIVANSLGVTSASAGILIFDF